MSGADTSLLGAISLQPANAMPPADVSKRLMTVLRFKIDCSLVDVSAIVLSFLAFERSVLGRHRVRWFETQIDSKWTLGRFAAMDERDVGTDLVWTVRTR